MSLHPALLAVQVVDALGVLSLSAAAWGALRVELGWTPQSPSASQLALERLSEEVSALGRIGAFFHLSAGLFLLLAVNHFLPPLVPGAMCGVGVLQAMPGMGQALALRALALGLLVIWHRLDRLNQALPLATMTQGAQKALFLAVPLAIVAAVQTFQAIGGLSLHEPVSCCAAVYDLAAKTGSLSSGHVEFPPWIALGLAGLIAAIALWMARKAQAPLPRASLLLAVLVALWSLLSGRVLIEVAGPYVYQTLGHHCPLCFFLPAHGAIGYPLYGALGFAVLQALSLVTEAQAQKKHPELSALTEKLRPRRLGLLLGSMAVFLLLAFGPMLLWRLRFGVWIDG